MEELETVVADNVFSDVDLDAFARTLQMGKPRFAHQAVRDNAAGDASFDAIGIEVRSSGLAKFGDQAGGSIGPAKLAGEGFVAQRLNLFELFLALEKLVLGLKLQ